MAIKTIALRERTFQILKALKIKRNLATFDELISRLVAKEEKIPKSMRGSLKGKAKPFTDKERNKMWKNKI